MKSTFAFIENNETENYARKIMLEAHKISELGFEACRLPHHLSLKQPFKVHDLKSIEQYFNEFVRTLKPI